MSKGYTNAQRARDEREQQRINDSEKRLIDMAVKISSSHDYDVSVLGEEEDAWRDLIKSARHFVSLLDYNKRKRGILRLRALPVGHEDRVLWYKTGDGRGVKIRDSEDNKMTLSNNYYKFKLGGYRERNFRY